MIMTLKGTDDIDVHPTKVSEMERKGWALAEPEKGSKKSMITTLQKVWSKSVVIRLQKSQISHLTKLQTPLKQLL